MRPGFQFIRVHIPRSGIAGSYGSCIFNFFFYFRYYSCVCSSHLWMFLHCSGSKGLKENKKQNFLHACINAGILTQDDGENFSTCLSQLRVAYHEPWKPLMLRTGLALEWSDLSFPQKAHLAQGCWRKMLLGLVPGPHSLVCGLWP